MAISSKISSGARIVGHALPRSPTNAAEALLREGRFEEAGQAYQSGLERAPNDARALINYGGVLNELCRFDEAESVLMRAISLDPQRLGAWSNLGITMLEQQRYEDAIVAFSNAIRINPSHVPALSGLGVTLRRRGLPAEALTFFDLAVSVEPRNPDTHHYRAMALLAAGDYVRGFAEYEWRWRTQAMLKCVINAPRWKGEPFHGRTLLVQHEGGLGDMLQFARYLPLLKARGGHVMLHVPTPLVSLLSRLHGIDTVAPDDGPPPAFDLTCPVMSLPAIFGTTLDTVPAAGGYLSAHPLIVAGWGERLAADAARFGEIAPLRVGLVWAGGPRPWNRENTLADRRRSTSLATLAPLAEAGSGILFYSLQIGAAGQEAATPPCGMRLIDHTHDIRNFDDTAGLVSLLDLVVAVDTSTAHLAAALGRPVWLLSRYDQCWRWLVGRTDSPWYETMRLYTQPAPFDWSTPVARIVGDLAQLACPSTD